MNVPPSLVDAFLKRAAKNTKKRIETCGLLLGSLDGGVFSACSGRQEQSAFSGA